MSRRIARFQQEGIDLNLRTDVERARDKETKRRLAEQKMQAMPGSSSQQASPKAARRAFVELDSDEEDVPPQPKRPKTSVPSPTQVSTLGRGRATVLGTRPSLSQPGIPNQAQESTTSERGSASPERSRRGATSPSAPTAVSKVVEEPSREPKQSLSAPISGEPDAAGSTQESALSREEVSTAMRAVSSAVEPAAENAGSSQAPDERPTTSAEPASTSVARVEVVEIQSVSIQKSPEPEPGPSARSEDNTGDEAAERVTAVSQPPVAQHTPRTVAPRSRSRSPAIVPPSPRWEDGTRPLQPRPSSTSTPRPHSARSTPSGGRNGSPALTPSQRVAHGAAIVTSARDAFKRNIMAYSKKYGCTPTELYTIVNGLGGKGAGRGGQMYWDDVERGLQDKFGY